jgi:hypothetical protein
MNCALAAEYPENSSPYSVIYPAELLEDVPDETRRMKVYYSPKDSACHVPMIRIANRHLLAHGFKPGDEIEVIYKRSEIIIKKI